MSDALQAAVAKLEQDGQGEGAVAAFRRRLEQLDAPGAGALPSDQLEPLEEPPALDDLPEPSDEETRSALDALVVLKLNGGLGTSMGLEAPKSSIDVKPGHTFLDVIARQVVGLRERYGARLPLVLMDSPSTREVSLEALEQHEGLDSDVPPDFLQGREPKLDVETHEPIEWPEDPDLEWCPPGHGDLYISLAASGMLEQLLDGGYRYAFVSNSDNLGALADPRIAAWMASEEVPFAMEVVRGTASERKGGHLARHDGRMVLRESAQVPEGDESFTDYEHWRWYNTNDLWLDLRALADLLAEHPEGPELPLIVNRKTVDPADPDSPAVIQLETAMGAAVGSIEGARAVHVPRTRFAPVKTTNDLLVVRSDAYELRDDGVMKQTFEGDGPVVSLDGDHFKRLADFEARFPEGPPSLREASSLTVEGDVTFGADVVVRGDVTVTGPTHVDDGTVLEG
jgi:UTP--glucose-1-phosphate uridylyltransferase